MKHFTSGLFLVTCHLSLVTLAAGQVPCLEDTSPPGLNSTIYMAGMAEPLPYHKAEWSPRRSPDTAVYKIIGGGWHAFDLWMPAAGRCVGSFTAYDDRDDLAVAITDAAGRRLGVDPRVAGDIEILIVDAFGLEQFRRGRNMVSFYSSGRVSGGDFDLDLPAGRYALIISNRHSMLAPKSVTLTLGPARRE